MKKYAIYVLTVVVGLCLALQPLLGLAQFPKLKPPALPQVPGVNANAAKPLTEQDVVKGLKEALQRGTETAVSSLNKTDGYLGDALLRIALPEEAERVEQTLRALPGGPALMDRLKVQMNRAAEQAAAQARPIFLQAISDLTIQDGWNILRGDSVAATTLLRERTQQALLQRFRPPIDQALDQVGARQTWQEVMTRYNQVPLVQQVNPDLTGHVTERALIGLFRKVAQEETRIRKLPAARVSDLLRRVFGSKS